ncbi:hypothetical protein C8Q79DRAFT_1014077 [Trametes meyenii]|nr:hypothetical protein C8Q79DRAFT_1014077 [Trametes meyenii]
MPHTYAQSTPVAHGTYRVQHDSRGQASGSIAHERKSLAQYRLASADDMAHKAVRMEPAEFIATYFTLPSWPARPEWPSNIFSELAKGGALLEAEIMERFIRVVNDNKLAGDLIMACSSEKPDMEEIDEFRQKIDAAFFHEDDFPLLCNERPNWAHQLVSVEFKRHETDKDPFDDRDEEKTDADSIERKRVRGQVITYAEQIFRAQHRTALFMLLVIGRHFRFLRWDRSGAIVTRAVDYVSEPDVLCEYLWRMSWQSEEALGVDPSAVRLRLDDHDYVLMDEYAIALDTDLATEERILRPEELHVDIPVFKYVRMLFRESLRPGWPRYRLQVPHDKGLREFLVGRPVFHAHGMAGRGTRGYVALDCQTKRFVWLKDAWRVHYDLVEQEGSILKKLNSKKVQFVPTLVCHGDIRNQTTDTPRVWEEKNPSKASGSSADSVSPTGLPSLSSSSMLAVPEPSSSTLRKRSRSEFDSDETLNFRDDCPLRRHMHYRIVEQEVAMPLSEFRCGRQLVSLIINCVSAHWEAKEKAGILHRDVSGGNVLILPRIHYDREDNQFRIMWTGFLADWEMSKPVQTKEFSKRPRQPPRTGTWQFLSVGILSRESKPVEVPDELESFLYVLLYHAIRYLRSNCSNVAALLESFFDAHTLVDGCDTYACGLQKLNAVKTLGRLEINDGMPLKFGSPLDKLFSNILHYFKAYYKVRSYRAKQQKSADQDDEYESDGSDEFDDACSSPSPASSLHHQRKRFAFNSNDPILFARTPKPVRIFDADKPSADDDEYAKLLESHEAFVGSLASVLPSRRWKEDDKVGDRVPDDYKPLYPIADEKGAAPSTVKRRRLMRTFPYDQCYTSMPSLRPSKSALPALGRDSER